MSLTAAFLSANPAAGQVFGAGPSDPGLFDLVIDSPPTQEPSSIGFDGRATQMNLFANGFVSGDFEVGPSSEFNLRGGVLDGEFDAEFGSEVNLLSGIVINEFTARNGSVVTVTGGAIYTLEAQTGSEVTISGGGIRGLDGRGGDLEIVGNEFKVDGAEYNGSMVDFPFGSASVLTGTLADGSPFAAHGRLLNTTLTRVPLQPKQTAPQTIDSAAGLGLPGLREDESLTLLEGGELREGFTVVDASITVLGGNIAPGLSLVRSDAIVAGGEFGEAVVGSGQRRLEVRNGSTLEVRDGKIDSDVLVNGGSEVRMLGGEIGDFAVVDQDSKLFIDGGRLGSSARIAGEAIIGGGLVGDDFRVSSEAEATVLGGTFEGTFHASSGSRIDLIGTEFFLDGVLLDGIAAGEQMTLAQRNVTLSGLLADGSSFSFELNDRFNSRADFFSEDAVLTLRIVEIPEPTGWILALAASAAFACRR